jgi:phosphonate transport system substrate-binding protein
MNEGNAFMLRRYFLAVLAVMLCLGVAAAQADSAKLKEFRLGLLGGENTQDRLARYNEFQKLLAERLGMPVKLFPAADYAGVMQAIAAGQLDGAQFSGSSFAGAWLDWAMIPVAIEIAALGALAAYGAWHVFGRRPVDTTARLPFGLFFAPAIWLSWLLGAAIFTF